MRTLGLAAVFAAALVLGALLDRDAGAPPPAIDDRAYAIVPLPVRVAPLPGRFTLDSTTTITLSDPDDSALRSLAGLAGEIVREATGLELRLTHSAPARVTSIRLVLSESSASSHPERYRLRVDRRSVTVSAHTHAGVFYGLQTLRQLLPAPPPTTASVHETEYSLPGVEIDDRPRFAYRGMHLDVARHFFPVEFVKRYIDLLAMYKMNTFHWHLTEDQGWRIEILKYPRLTEVGAYRSETIVEKNFRPYVGDGTPHGGFYTQEEIREVVAYAQSRYVTVIPEIEMPGHSKAALAAYPELACTEGPFEVATVWGVHDDIYCPSERTFAFLEDVLTEVMDLFPSRYIHIGGDEAPKTRWRESDLAQEIIRREGLADEHELQSYFIKRIERFLATHDRRLIGWDEILEGGLAPEATVMSWRGMDGGIAAARLGHDVVMTPGSHVYFDHYQGDRAFEPLAIGGYSPLEKVYAFEPVPDALSSAEARHVLGAQGNVWTEYMKTPEHVEYMVFPRLLALAEVVWSPRDARDWDGFVSRLPSQLRLLDAWDVNYRIPHVRGLESDRLTLADRVEVALETLIPDATIRYTVDGTDPTDASPRYTAPLDLAVEGDGIEVRARAFLSNGRASPSQAARFAKTDMQPAESVDARALGAGLRYAYYETAVSSVNRLRNAAPARRGITPTVTLLGFERAERFGLTFSGYLRVPRDGVYSFLLTSDDGSDLVIAGRTVIDHDGLHSATDQTGMIALQAGYHPIAVRFFQGGGGKDLRLTGKLAETAEYTLMADWLFHER